MDPVVRSTAGRSPAEGIVRLLDAAGKTKGTGFFVSEDGLIVTCTHVISAARMPDDTVWIVPHGAPASTSPSRAEVDRDLTRGEDGEDIGFLRLLELPPDGVSWLALADAERAPGERLTTFGFPGSKPVDGMPEVVEVVGVTTETGFPVVQVRSSVVSHGFSGAPVWDDQGSVAGVIISVACPDALARQADVAFMRPARMVVEICPALRTDDPNPYRGLDVFDLGDADLYFGRDAGITELLSLLSRHSIVPIVGVSGSGKSSLARAGLVKGLRSSTVPGLAGRDVRVVVPGPTPLLDLVTSAVPSRLEGTLREAEARLLDRSVDELTAAILAQLGGTILVIDQFERVFYDRTSAKVRDHIVAIVLGLGAAGARCVLTLRADYYAISLARPGLDRIMQEAQLTLLPMTDAELMEAITDPAALRRRSFESGLPERIIADVRGRTGDLPLLEFALTRLWELNAGPGPLTVESYRQLGYTAADGRQFPGIQGAVAARAEAVWESLGPGDRDAARRVFVELISGGRSLDSGDEGAVAGRAAWLNELDEAAQSIARQLADARLLTIGRSTFGDEATVELSHDALLRAWPTLAAWVQAYRPFTIWRDRDLDPLWEQWVRSGHDPELLLRPGMLSAASRYLDEFASELTGSREQYIRESLAADQARRDAEVASARRRALRAVAVAVGFAVIAALAVGGFAVARNNARTARETAARYDRQRHVAISERLAAAALEQVGQDPEIALLLAREAARNARTSGAENALRSALTSRLEHTLPGSGDAINGVAFSPRGDLAAVSVDDVVRIYDVERARLVHTIRPHAGDGLAIALARNTDTLLIAGTERAGTWNLRTGARIALARAKTPSGDPFLDEIHCSITPDGRLATYVGKSKAIAWDTRSGRPVRVPWTRSVAPVFSGDGSTVAIQRRERDLVIYDAVHQRVIRTIRNGEPFWAPASFDDRGRRVMTEGHGKLLVREVGDGRVVLRRRVSRAATALIDPSGRTVVLGPKGRGIAWSIALDNGRQTRLPVEDVGFLTLSPDGHSAVEALDDGSRAWDLASGVRLADLPMQDPTGTAYFDPYRPVILTEDNDAHLRVWHVTGRAFGRTPPTTTEAIALSPGGKLLAAVEGRTLRVRSVPDARLVRTTPVTTYSPGSDHALAHGFLSFENGTRSLRAVLDDKVVYDVDLTSGKANAAAIGANVATMTTKGTVVELGYGDRRAWADVRRPGTNHPTPRVYGPVDSRVYGGIEDAASSDDGRLLAMVTTSGDAEIRDSGTQKLLGAFRGKSLQKTAVDPSGSKVAFVSATGTVFLWTRGNGRFVPLKDGVQILSFQSAFGGISDLAFSPDGGLLIARNPILSVVEVLSADTGMRIARIEHAEDVAISPDGAYIAVGREKHPVVVDRCDACGTWSQLVERADRRIRRGFSAAERVRFLLPG
ncbi:nSTAND1 domain-containing NTPase [Baekduia sp. Peel2402]|uniref:nSTAND1 domain-containing NTPase n=1 Tax=Baekduia sp. Peel2402 TaxID=3458296 RepID=UPI00403E46E4